MRGEPPRWVCESLLWSALAFGVAAFGATEWWSLAMFEALIFASASACALRADSCLRWSSPLAGVGLVVAFGLLQAMTVSPVGGPMRDVPFTFSRERTLYWLLWWCAMGALCWAATEISAWPGAVKRLCWALFSIGMFIAVAGLLQRTQGNLHYYGVRAVMRGVPFGPFTNLNHGAGWMAGAALLGTGLLADVLSSEEKQLLSERVSKVILVAFMLTVILIAIGAAGSRGAFNATILAAAATLGVLALSRKSPLFRRAAFMALLSAGVVYAASLIGDPRLVGFIDGKAETSAAYRLAMYSGGLKMLRDAPLFGVGLGSFGVAFPAYKPELIIGVVDHVHSSWLEVLLEMGIPGVAALIALLALPSWSLGRRVVQSGPRAGFLFPACFAAILSMVLHGCVEFTFQIPANAALLVVLVAAVCTGPEVRPAPWPGVSRAGRSLVAAVFIAAAAASLPPGFAGRGLRFGPPFGRTGDRVLAPSTGSGLGGWLR